jgi:esterase/lipase
VEEALMRIRDVVGLVVGLSIGGLTSAALASPADDFKAALAKAEAANQEAGALKNQWTTTADAFKAAQAAAAAGHYVEAIKDAQQAEALANASIAQAKEQVAIWRQAVVR